jgi:hypothetical protein
MTMVKCLEAHSLQHLWSQLGIEMIWAKIIFFNYLQNSCFRVACYTSYLSQTLSLSLSVCLSVSNCISIFACLCLFLSVSLYLCLSVCISVSLLLSVFIFVCLLVSLPLCLSVSLFLCLSVSLFLCLSVSLSLCLSVSMFLCLSVSLSLCFSVSLSIFYLSNVNDVGAQLALLSEKLRGRVDVLAVVGGQQGLLLAELHLLKLDDQLAFLVRRDPAFSQQSPDLSLRQASNFEPGAEGLQIQGVGFKISCLGLYMT